MKTRSAPAPEIPAAVAVLVDERYPTEAQSGAGVPEPVLLAVPEGVTDAVYAEPGNLVAFGGERVDDITGRYMVAWRPPAADALRLAMIGGEPPEELHLTLAIVDGDAAVVADAVRRATSVVGALRGTIGGGVVRFPGEPDGDGDPFCASVDIPGLDALRVGVVAELQAAGAVVLTNHGFSPHITLAWLDPMTATPPAPEQMPATIDALVVVGGDGSTVATVPLVGGAAPSNTVDDDAVDDAVGEEPEDEAPRFAPRGIADPQVTRAALATRVRRMDAGDPAAMSGVLMRSAFPTSRRALTADDRALVDRIFTERYGKGLGKGHVSNWVISTAIRARDGHTIAPRGWLLANHARNPVVLWMHDRERLPVGRSYAFIAPDGTALCAIKEFVTRDVDVFGGTVGDMVDGGFLHAPSVGWDTLAATRVRDQALIERYGYPLDITSADLLEDSIVTIPSDVETGVLRARAAGIDVEPFAHRFTQWADEAPNAARRAMLGAVAIAARPGRAMVIMPATKETPMPIPRTITTRTTRQGLRCPTCHGAVRAPDAPDPNAAPPPPNLAGGTSGGVEERSPMEQLPPELQSALQLIAAALVGGGAAPAPQAPPAAAAAPQAPPAPATDASGSAPPADPNDDRMDSGSQPGQDDPDIAAARARLWATPTKR